VRILALCASSISSISFKFDLFALNFNVTAAFPSRVVRDETQKTRQWQSLGFTEVLMIRMFYHLVCLFLFTLFGEVFLINNHKSAHFVAAV
jgi:hypothetical protein